MTETPSDKKDTKYSSVRDMLEFERIRLRRAAYRAEEEAKRIEEYLRYQRRMRGEQS